MYRALEVHSNSSVWSCIRQIHRNANPSICNKNHTVGEVEIRAKPSLLPRLTSLFVPRYFSRGSSCTRYFIHTYIRTIHIYIHTYIYTYIHTYIHIATPFASFVLLAFSSRSVGWDQGRLMYSLINSRVSGEFAPLEERRKRHARMNPREQKQGGNIPFCLSSSQWAFVRARGYNGNKSSLGRSLPLRTRCRHSLASYLISVELTIQGMRVVGGTISKRSKTRS